MTFSALALLGFAAWTMVLLAGIALLRGTLTLRGARSANSFAVGGEDVSPFSARLCRAHANCYENLPVFASILAVAVFSGHGAMTDPLALWALAARVAQSCIHLISTRNLAVQLRFSFLMAQWVIQAYWLVVLLGV
jgi:uncharacterized MAPEG superfamily protein